jgi:hypothetical protein
MKMRKTVQKSAIQLLTTMALASSDVWAAAIQVSGVQTYIGGTNTSVPGSGTANNFKAGVTNGSFAVFDMQKDGQNFANLRVTYNGGAGSDKILVARTSDSQGLTDTGTITILLDHTTAGYTGAFKFDWFTPGSFVNGSYIGGSLISDAILYTTFDIDYYQFVGAKTNQLQSYAFNTNTLLRADLMESPGFIRAEDSNAMSTVTEPKTAVQFLTRSGPASHDMIMGKQSAGGAALFMFEFRDPSQVLGNTFTPVPVSIPEPTSMLLACSVLAIGFWIRRRFID